jgi:hypothetical protein
VAVAVDGELNRWSMNALAFGIKGQRNVNTRFVWVNCDVACRANRCAGVGSYVVLVKGGTC